MASVLVAGSLTGIVVGLPIAILAHASASTVLSLAPKSATAAVSMEISRLIGGEPAVTATLTILTGIIGAVAGPYVLDMLSVRAPDARGFALTSGQSMTACSGRYRPPARAGRDPLIPQHERG